MNKRILLSLGMLIVAGAVVAGGTGAFFSDTETSTNNVFTAGSVSIGFGGINHVYAYGADPVEGYFSTTTQDNIPRFALNDLKPRDAGQLTFDLDNGSNEAYVCGLVTGTAPTTAPDVALYDNLQFYNSDDDQVTFGNWFDLGKLDANATSSYEIDYCFGEGKGTACSVDPLVNYNAAQNGSFSADLQLYAIQTRNNDNFTCDSLNEPLVYVGTNPSDSYQAPEDGFIVSKTPADGEFSTIAAAIDSVDSGGTILVEDGVYNENVTLPWDTVTLAAVHQGGATINGSVSLQGSEQVVQGFVITGGDTSSPSDNGVNVAPNSVNTVIKDNTIDGSSITSGVGIEVSAGANNLTIENNVIKNWTQSGTYLNPTAGPIMITQNDYHTNNVGIGTDGISNVTVTRNDFAGNTVEAMGVAGTGSTIAINQNNFTPAGTGNDVNAYASVTGVNATGNFWSGEVVADRTNLSSDIDTTGEAATAFPTH